MPTEKGPDAAPRSGRFTTTRWSLVRTARDRADPGWREALSDLCGIYWYPIYAFARRTGNDPETAQDLTQEFFTRLLERDTLAYVDQAKGRFRSFLLASFKNFVTDEARKAMARKRGGGQVTLSIDLEAAEGRYHREPSHSRTPEKIYERRWALTVLERAIQQLRGEHSTPRKKRAFEVLKVFLPGGGEPVPYADAARALDMNEVSVKVAIHRFRRRFRALLLEEIAHTVETEEEIDAEVRHLMTALEAD